MAELFGNMMFILDQLSHNQPNPPSKSKLQQYREQIKKQYEDAEELVIAYKDQTGDLTFRTGLEPVQKWGDRWNEKDKWKEIQLRVLKVKELLDFLLKNLKIEPKSKRDYSSVSGIMKDNETNIKTLNKVSSIFKQMKTTAGGKRKTRKKRGKKRRKTRRKKRTKRRKTKRRRKRRKK